MIISDPLFGRNESGIHEIEDVFEGRWSGCFSCEQFTNERNRWYISIKSEKFNSTNEFYQTRQQSIQKVYSGYLGIFDSQHYHAYSFFSKYWYEHCKRKMKKGVHCAQITCGIIFQIDKEECRISYCCYRKNGVLHRLDMKITESQMTANKHVPFE